MGILSLFQNEVVWRLQFLSIFQFHSWSVLFRTNIESHNPWKVKLFHFMRPAVWSSSSMMKRLFIYPDEEMSHIYIYVPPCQKMLCIQIFSHFPIYRSAYTSIVLPILNVFEYCRKSPSLPLSMTHDLALWRPYNHKTYAQCNAALS